MNAQFLFAHPSAPLALEAARRMAGGDVRVLEEGVAYHALSTAPVAAVAGVDVLALPYPSTPKRLLISDMDSTMIEQECIDELADFVGKKAHVAAITEAAMRGELDFEAALSERVALLKGLAVSVLEECFRTRVVMMEGARELVQAFRARGGHAVLVSGGFTAFTSRVAEALGFHEHYANVLEESGGQLTGRVIAPILGKEAKRTTLEQLLTQRGIAREDVLAIGDGANDIPMLQAAGVGVAFRAKPAVQAAASYRLNHARLDCLRFV